MYKLIGGDQKEYGPVTAQELRRWIAEGRLNGASLIQPDGSADWKPLAGFPEFAEALRLQSGASSLNTATAAGADAAKWESQLAMEPPELPVFHCLAKGWELLRDNFGLFFAATFLVWAVGLCEMVPGVGIIAWLLQGVFYGGLSLVILRRIRGGPAAVGDVFAGFRVGFPQLLLAGFLSSLLARLGVLFCLLPGLYLFVAWTFCVPLVADRGLEFWPAMELSRKVVTRVWFQMLGLLVLVFIPSIAAYVFAEVKISAALLAVLQGTMNNGQPDLPRLMQAIKQVVWTMLPMLLVTKFVLLFNMPFAVSALMCAYETLFGARPASRP